MILVPWDDEDDTKPVSYSVTQDPEAVNIDFETGHKVWIELEAGRIRVHCFHPGEDEPVNVEIYSDRIEVQNANT